MRHWRMSLLALCLVSCAVKSRDPQVVQTAVGLPTGVQVSRGQAFLVRGTPQTLLPGEENTLTFQILDAAFVPVDLGKTKLSIRYIMPTMPQMGVFKTEPKIIAPGKAEAVFDIVHGGLWRLTLQLDTDEVVFEYNVR